MTAGVEAAFASVPRERFLGRGPWPILRWDRGYVPTPSRNAVYIYDDVLIGILPERKLNNGQLSLHALLIASAAPRSGDHAVHIGAGVGYYTAILAHLVGRRGRVTAIEYDPALAAVDDKLQRRAQRPMYPRRWHPSGVRHRRCHLRQCRSDAASRHLA